jgi:hypothetical protein
MRFVLENIALEQVCFRDIKLLLSIFFSNLRSVFIFMLPGEGTFGQLAVAVPKDIASRQKLNRRTCHGLILRGDVIWLTRKNFENEDAIAILKIGLQKYVLKTKCLVKG